MKVWFEQLAPRERLILAGGALLVVLVVGWSFVWKPLDNRALELDNEVAELDRLLVDLRRAAGLRETGSGAARAVSSALLTLIPQTAEPHGLVFEQTRIESGGNAIYVTFRGAVFDALNAWFTELELTHGITVSTVRDITASGTSGLVNGQVLLTRS